MTFFVFQPAEREFLAEDERSWTLDFFSAAGFTSRELAEGVAVRELGEGHGAYVFDDGLDQ